MVSERNQSHVKWFHWYEMHRLGKSIGTDYVLVTREVGKWEECLITTSFFGSDKKKFQNYVWWLHNWVNMLKLPNCTLWKRRVNFKVYYLYINKTIRKRKKGREWGTKKPGRFMVGYLDNVKSPFDILYH